MKVSISIVCTLLCISCSDYSNDIFDPTPIFQSISISPTELEGDGESTALISITFPNEIPAGKASAEIMASAGLFKESGKDVIQLTGSLEVQSDGSLLRKSNATLISPAQDVTSKITIKIAGYARKYDVTFGAAYADDMVVESDKLALKKGLENTATITVTLLREMGKGKPSLKSEVEIKATDIGGAERGIIYPKVSKIGVDGKCKFTVSRGALDFNGPLDIIATARQGKKVSKKIQILQID